MKKFVIVTVIAVTFFVGSVRPSYAGYDWPILVPIMTAIGNSAMAAVTSTLSQATGISLSNADSTNRAVLSSSQAINANSDKNTVAMLNAQVAIEDSRRQYKLNTDIATLTDQLQQPGTSCSTMQGTHDVASAGASASLLGASGSRDITQSMVGGNQSTSQSLLVSFNATTTTYCDDTLAGRGLCDKSTAALNKDKGVDGADINAANLFGTPAGGSQPGQTYVSADQQAGVDAYVHRIVVQGSPELLQNASWDKSSQGKYYVELSRRYVAFRSLSAYSLNQIQASHAAVSAPRIN